MSDNENAPELRYYLVNANLRRDDRALWLGELDALVERVQRAEKALADATTPDIIGGGDETAYAEDDFSGIFDGLNFFEIVEVWANKQLGERWAARIVTKWDEDGDVEEDEVRLFASLRLAEEAQAAAEATRPKVGP